MQAFTADETAAQSQLTGGETAGFTCSSLIHTRDFKHDMAGKDNSHPEFGRAFTFTHSNFWRALGDWLVREDADEYLAFTLEESGDSNTAGFNVDIFNPATLKGLKTKVTEIQLIAAGGIPSAVAAL